MDDAGRDDHGDNDGIHRLDDFRYGEVPGRKEKSVYVGFAGRVFRQLGRLSQNAGGSYLMLNAHEHMAIRVAGDIVAAATIFSVTLILLVIF